METPVVYNAGIGAIETRGGVSSEVAQRRELAEVQGQIFMARQFPRNTQNAIDKIINACSRPKLAAGAIYQYARGGADIAGPSIRLAEAVAQGWGNMQYGVRELEQRNGESVCEAFAWDMENNVRVAKSFKVPHIRHTREGTKALVDPRDIYETVANQGARRLRACILAVVPGDVTEEAVEQCEKTLAATADTSPKAIKKMVDAFAEFNVEKAQIEAHIQRRLDAITPAQVINLRKIYASLKDGMSKAADWFDKITATPETSKKTTLRSKAAEAAKEKAKPESPEKPHEAKPEAKADPEPEELDLDDEGEFNDDNDPLPFD